MTTTWVAVLKHGLVEPRPFPEYFRRYAEQLAGPNARIAATRPLADHPAPDLGQELFRARPGPKASAVLLDAVFETSFEDANLVGNIYFAQYATWQARAFEQALQRLMPGFWTQGEFRCERCAIQHLREAMPFDQIRVQVSLDAMYEYGLHVRFEYLRVAEGGRDVKLAVGEQHVRWRTCGANRSWNLAPLPAELRVELLRAAEGDEAAREPRVLSLLLKRMKAVRWG